MNKCVCGCYLEYSTRYDNFTCKSCKLFYSSKLELDGIDLDDEESNFVLIMDYCVKVFVDNKVNYLLYGKDLPDISVYSLEDKVSFLKSFADNLIFM